MFISNGLLHDHPHEKAYENFKLSSRLQRVGKHKILVPTSKTKGFIHLTPRAIYSTLSSGMITAELEEEGNVKVYTDKEGEIEVYLPTLMELALEKVVHYYSTFERDQVKEHLLKKAPAISNPLINTILFNLPKEVNIQEEETKAEVTPVSKQLAKSLFRDEEESQQEEGQMTPLKSKKKRSGKDKEELKKKKKLKTKK